MYGLYVLGVAKVISCGFGSGRIGIQGINHFVFCKTVAVMFLWVSHIFELAGILSRSTEKNHFLTMKV